MENNMTISEKLLNYGIKAPDILLPKEGIDKKKWAVVACDQYTSQPEYWESLSEEVSSDPSTLRIIYPEVYLESGDKEKIISSINEKMNEYLSSGIFIEYKDSFILVERTTESGTRYGLMVALDLDAYDYAKDSKTLIRATEGTILSRIPPRKEIRKDAPIELPHIMVLISDAEKRIIEPLVKEKNELEKVYDTDLNKNGGHIIGYLVNSKKDKERIADGFEALYKALDPKNPLLFAMGDGNHSLATAKSCWEDIKATLTDEEKLTHPARFALVELENIFDPGLLFEPIHRVFFNINQDTFDSLLSSFCTSFKKEKVSSKEEMLKKVNEKGQHFGLNEGDNLYVYTVEGGDKAISAGTIQLVIDKMLEEKKGEVDYIHGVDVTLSLGAKKGNLGIILPDVSKENFFSDMLKDGAYPRKTFSIGHANEKRYYMEARKIK